jgi:hypothetical protein
MGQVSMGTREELVAAIRGRYSVGTRTEKTRILDEFVAITGFHRKHVVKLLRGNGPAEKQDVRRDHRRYGAAVREALVVMWEASDRICGKRLHPLIPLLVNSMEQHGYLSLDAAVRLQLLAMSAATIDRALQGIKAVSASIRTEPAIDRSQSPSCSGKIRRSQEGERICSEFT